MLDTRGEFIGLEVEVIDSKNKSLIGVKGRIIDETKETFIIEYNKKTITIIKKMARLKINGQEIEGMNLFGKPEDRIKK